MKNSAIERQLKPYLSPVAAWALALGTSLGWGSLVLTSSTYLRQAGPAGSALGMIVGTAIMLIVSRNYFYMINFFPEAGGAYTYAASAFGYDHGFLAAWFLTLTYLAVLWANATALPLFARYFLGRMFEVGYMYSLFEYDVYIGEALLSVAAIVIAAFILTKGRKLIAHLMVGMVVFFFAGIVICFLGALILHDQSFAPHFVPDSDAIGQIVKIAVISPWAFIGFENISHAAEEFDFKRQIAHTVLTVSVVTTGLLYICVTLLSASAYPPEYDSWLSYIRDIGNLSGIKGLPAFYAAEYYMGSAGVTILMIALLCLVVTSLFGNTLALSRLFYAMARDQILPSRYAEINDKGNPEKAIVLIACISLIVPFLGRTAIGWIVDVTTLGATLIYGFVSAATWKMAREGKDSFEMKTGLAGMIIMIGFGAYLLIPNLFMTGSMEPESYFLFVAWSVIGVAYFYTILRRDDGKRFGRSIIVWIGLLSLILFVSLVWMSQSILNVTTTAMNNLQEYYTDAGFAADQSGIIARELASIRATNARSIIVVVAVFALSLGMLINNYATMSRRAAESEAELGHVKNLANTDPLTGVKSKHAYAETEKMLDEAIASGAQGDFAVIVCDVNGLKHVNDTLGHKAGDEYIKAASHMICEIFSHSPVFRTGGDEFVVLLTGRDYNDREALLKAVHDTSVAHIAEGKVVVSAGLSDFVKGEDTKVKPVFERADALMYEEKKLLKSMGAVTRL